MSFADEERAIQSRMDANFTTLPIKYEDDEKFTQPKTPWVEFRVLTGEGFQPSLGAPGSFERHAGIIQAIVNIPAATRPRTAKTHCDTIAGVFRSVQFSAGSSGTITTRTPFITNLGIAEGWQRYAVSIPYTRDRKT